MSFLNSLNISSSALTAQRLRMDVISENIANATTTRTSNNQPYRRKMVVFQENEPHTSFDRYLSDEAMKYSGGGVKVASIEEDTSPFKYVYEPGHPDADAQGYVRMPNVDTVKEMMDMISATRSYEANVTAINASKAMAVKALEIGR